MPSGLTHMILSRKSLDKIANNHADDLHALLGNYRGAFMAGCVAPDLPYMTLMDLNLFEDRKTIADSMHYKATTTIPTRGLLEAKSLVESGNFEKAELLFAFYLGYCSHLIADGVIHPYVRDQVGDYEHAATEHRTLEMKLDVFVAENLLGLEANNINFHEELTWIKDQEDFPDATESFAKLLYDAYGYEVKSDEIQGWIKILDRVFDLATGEFPKFYRDLMGDRGLSLKNVADVKKEVLDVLVLKNPIDADKHGLTSNYMNKPEVHFFKDVVPQYFDVFVSVAIRAHEFVFQDGPEVSDVLHEINLDTGRLLADQSLKNRPAFLGGIA